LADFCGETIQVEFKLTTDFYTTDDGFYLDEFKVQKIQAAEHLTQIINLSEGWNSLSGYLIPDYPSIDSVFAPVWDKIEMISSGPDFFKQGNSGSTLQNFSTAHGYHIKLSEPATLHINGEPESYLTLFLTPGWHLIPCISGQTIGIDQLSFQPDNNIEFIQEPTSRKIFWPDKNLFSLDSLVPGKSYRIFLIKDGSVRFPE
nr:hypothetical protein [Bacteroidota bacterium]